MKQLQQAKNFEYLIWDLDKTIVSLEIPWDEVKKQRYELIKKYDKQIAEEFLNKLNYSKLNNLVDDYPGFKPEWDKLINKFEQKFEGAYSIIPPTIEFLNENTNKNYYLWTTNYESTAKNVLSDLKLLGYFKVVVGADTHKYFKPAAKVYHELFHLPREKTVMIGDSDTDRQAAENSGISFIKV
jgi:HAD superfamily hydrolase (TIGR01549 family)